MEVVVYNRYRDIWVRFIEHGNLVHTSWNHFSDGNVANPYDRTLYDVGYLGEGEYRAWLTDKFSPQYVSWRNMITRCYSEVEHKRSPRYKDCTVVEEWHNFQNFAAWYGQNYYEVDGETMSLDKDILYKGNKVYSPETCVFVPNRINMLFVKRNASRGELPIGVTSCKRDKKYQTHCNSLGVLGRYDTIEEAFSVYKVNKEKLIKQIANDYSDKIPKRLYDTMVNYKVEVTD